MYDFKKLAGEEILFITDDTVLKKSNKDVKVSSIVTNKRLLFLDYPNKIHNYQEDLKLARGLDYVNKKEVIFEVLLCDIETIEENNDYDKYILKDENYFFIQDYEVRKHVLQKEMI